ncbi:hypothetical protein HDZ31DRAFT_75616 [Schizophyllum fasciatum]
MLTPETPGRMPVGAPQVAIDKLPVPIQDGINDIFDLIKEEREKAANAARQEVWRVCLEEKEQAVTLIQGMEADKVSQRTLCDSLRERVSALEAELSRSGQDALQSLANKLDSVEAHAGQKIEALETKVGTLTGELATAERGRQDLEIQLKDKDQALQKKTQEADETTKTNLDLTARICDLQAELASSRTYTSSITEQLALINAGVDRQSQMLQESQEQCTESAANLDAAEKEIQALKVSLQVDTQKWLGERAALQAEIAGLSTEHTLAARRAESLQCHLDSAVAKGELSTRKLTEAYEQQRDYRRRKEADAKKEHARLTARIAELEQLAEKAGGRIRELECALANSNDRYSQLAMAVNESGFLQVRDGTPAITAELLNFVVALASHTAAVDQPQTLANAPPLTLCATLARCEKAALQMQERTGELERQLAATQEEARHAMSDVTAARSERATAITKVAQLQQEVDRLGDEVKKATELCVKYRQMAVKARSDARDGACPKFIVKGPAKPEDSSIPAKRPPPSTSAAPPKKLLRTSGGPSPPTPKAISGRAQPSNVGSQSPVIPSGSFARTPCRPDPPVVKQERSVQSSSRPGSSAQKAQPDVSSSLISPPSTARKHPFPGIHRGYPLGKAPVAGRPMGSRPSG